MTITEISELVGLIAVGLGLIGSIVGWVSTLVKNIREKKLQKYVEMLMVEAEKSNLTGDQKREYVLTGLLHYAKELGGNLNAIIDKASAYIEDCIDFSKKINAKK